jgi:hypothetical protein
LLKTKKAGLLGKIFVFFSKKYGKIIRIYFSLQKQKTGLIEKKSHYFFFAKNELTFLYNFLA